MPSHVRTVQLGTYPPTQCGIATFTAALHGALDEQATSTVVRVVDAPTASGQPEVVGHLVRGSATSARRVRELLDDHDVVVVQHEYGIFGGPDGSDVVPLIEALRVPVVVVLHTVLEEPTARQRGILLRLLEASQVAVTMTQTARERLVRCYGADPTRVVVVPHGAVDHRGVRAVARRDDRPLLLTWGLLGPGKGIEHAIEAVAGLRDLSPRYLVLGRTHPKVAEHDGEDYRNSLRRRIDELGVGDLVELDDSYLGVQELAAVVASSDVVLLPYDSRDQVTSGVLTEAVAAGRPVVSTAFPHAVELLTGGPGLVVPQGDATVLRTALRRVLIEPGLADELGRRARERAPDLMWRSVASRYLEVADRLLEAHALAGTG